MLKKEICIPDVHGMSSAIVKPNPENIVSRLRRQPPASFCLLYQCSDLPLGRDGTS